MKLTNFNRSILIENKFLEFYEDTYVLPNGEPCSYYHAAQNDAVIAIAVNTEVEPLVTYVVNQYRHPIGKTLWQFPCGGFDSKLRSPVDAARDELAEETGISVGRIRLMGSFYANPGFTNQKIHVCVSSEILGISEPVLDKTEYGLVSKKIRVSEVPNLIETGAMGDSWGITGLHYLDKYLQDASEVDSSQ